MAFRSAKLETQFIVLREGINSEGLKTNNGISLYTLSLSNCRLFATQTKQCSTWGGLLPLETWWLLYYITVIIITPFGSEFTAHLLTDFNN